MGNEDFFFQTCTSYYIILLLFLKTCLSCFDPFRSAKILAENLFASFILKCLPEGNVSAVFVEMKWN